MSKPPAKKAPAKRRKPTRPTPKPKVVKPPKGGPKIDPSKVELVQRPGPKDKGDGAGGEYWEVIVEGARAGEVFVNLIDEPPLGKHASMQIFLNGPDQGKGVGRAAYLKAAQASAHNPLYLHMRKSNHASRLAAEAAGFRDAALPGIAQLILKRTKGSD
ncbi:GNAT family N-acetyltransferase [Sphingobium sp. YR768]|uniref:GNAT family N-acetyltransferase n=1 Tax=Sphingobium sp. YR768 TaxID=1884365 RepID=UPI0008C89A64|nr:GNAT family protein [Sphingobium sp. YR768]SER23439.1 hypothetical protein SAMN05518866_10738 [Sphingobium sp. YR768]